MAFQAFAVGTSAGPHVTLQAGTTYIDRYWSTTTRGSVKVAAVRRRPFAAVAERNGGHTRLRAGRAAVLDWTRPTDARDDLVAAVGAGVAVVQLGLSHLKQLRGYVEAAGAVPVAWYPPGRAMVVMRHERELVIDENLEVTTAQGAWARQPEPVALAHGRQSQHYLSLGLGRQAHDLLSEEGAGAWLGVTVCDGVAVVPAQWRLDTGARVPRAALERIGPVLPGPVCLMIDNSDSPRPDRKLGVMLRGGGQAIDQSAKTITVAVTPFRITTWNGFDITTIDAA